MEEKTFKPTGLQHDDLDYALIERLVTTTEDTEKQKLDIAMEMGPESVVGALRRAINEAIDTGKFGHKPFFVELLIRKDPKLTENHDKVKPIVYPLCPMPVHEAAVYKVNPDGSDELLWVVPSFEHSVHMLNNPLHVEDKELFQYLLDFMDFTLRRKAIQINKDIECTMKMN